MEDSNSVMNRAPRHVVALSVLFAVMVMVIVNAGNLFAPQSKLEAQPIRHESVLRGVVIDTMAGLREPVAGAEILVLDPKYPAIRDSLGHDHYIAKGTANAEGDYFISIPDSGTYVVAVKAIGYKIMQDMIEFKSDSIKRRDYQLTEALLINPGYRLEIIDSTRKGHPSR